DVGAHAAGAVLEHDNGQPAGAAGNPQLPAGRRCLGVGVTAQELGIRKCQSIDRMQLGARGEIHWLGGGTGGGEKQQCSSGTNAIHQTLPQKLDWWLGAATMVGA